MTAPVPRPLAAVLAGSTPPGVLSWPADRPVADALAAATAAGWQAAGLDLTDVRDKAAFLDRCARALGFPDWFGHNWDALADCLTDLSWCPAARGRLLVITGWQGFAAAASEDWHVVENVIADSVAYWRDSGTGLAVILARGPARPAGG